MEIAANGSDSGAGFGRPLHRAGIGKDRARDGGSYPSRDERRDRCLSVLEICREFVSWRGDRFVAIARRSSSPRAICPVC